MYFQTFQKQNKLYDLPGFKAVKFDEEGLVNIGIDYKLNDHVIKELNIGFDFFEKLYKNRALNPMSEYVELISTTDEELEAHNYTGICPTNVLEINPSAGSCSVACQYCLVTDGTHCEQIKVITNYAEKLKNSLERNRQSEIFYYFSPKTEAFSEPHLFNGLAHEILLTFIRHYQKYPDSKVRVFIATKCGLTQLQIRHNNNSLLELIKEIPSKIQVNGSITILPDYLRNLMEPNASSFRERLEALKKLQDMGVYAKSVLCQPLLIPYLTENNLHEYFSILEEYGITNIKPEFLTTEIKNLVLIAQYIHHFDPHLIGEYFYPYLKETNLDHIKQRSRMAPSREICVKYLKTINDIASRYNISISICNWVKKELAPFDSFISTIDRESSGKGLRCLGYQTNLFEQ
jgi:DNA repair photolyase